MPSAFWKLFGASLAALVVLVTMWTAVPGPAATPHQWIPPRSGGSFALPAAPALWVDTLTSTLSVRDAAQGPWGWVLLDARAPAVRVLEEGGALRSFGRRGGGPGELDHPIQLEVSGGLAAVLDRDGKRVDFFDLTGEWIARTDAGMEECPLSLPLGFVAADGESFLLLQSCTHPTRGIRSRLVRLAPGQAEVLEEGRARSLLSLQPFSTSVLARHGGVVYTGEVSGRCLHRVDAGRAGDSTLVCHPSSSGPALPDSARVAFQELDGRAGRLGGSVGIPERLPPWTGVEASGDRLVFRVPLADGREVLDVLVGDIGADAVLRRVVPPAESAVFFGPDQILVVRDLLGGVEVRAVAFP